jgi:hypothetical protein
MTKYKEKFQNFNFSDLYLFKNTTINRTDITKKNYNFIIPYSLKKPLILPPTMKNKQSEHPQL